MASLVDPPLIDPGSPTVDMAVAIEVSTAVIVAVADAVFLGSVVRPYCTAVPSLRVTIWRWTSTNPLVRSRTMFTLVVVPGETLTACEPRSGPAMVVTGLAMMKVLDQSTGVGIVADVDATPELSVVDTRWTDAAPGWVNEITCQP